MSPVYLDNAARPQPLQGKPGEVAYESGVLPREVISQWDELDLHLALDELTREGSAPEGEAGARPGYGGHGRSMLSSGSDRSKQKRGPRPRLFKKNSCQADNCSEDLSTFSFYYQRNHICPTHLKCAEYSVRGVAMRFCQRCGVGHAIEEFSGGKRSCKKALERHNQRRREKQAGASASGPSAAATASSSQAAELGAEWEVSSRPSSIYAAAQPWSLPTDMLHSLGMAPVPDTLYLPGFQGDLPAVGHAPRWAPAAPHLAYAPPPAPYQPVQEPMLSSGSVALPPTGPCSSRAEMSPMPADQLSWLASQL
ncbi:hypothetical protein QBZ16_001627 [Prototheca wickerhamii]|uniref:SBP-type domain-containing protein n=1 Tax=Prototheca wickerhamii TaxID=3111 RepID=A0AAD9MJ14_PROWI|nr:hypothetical protein QBZ16_001627 [Prototheca wickerhamii]